MPRPASPQVPEPVVPPQENWTGPGALQVGSYSYAYIYEKDRRVKKNKIKFGFQRPEGE